MSLVSEGGGRQSTIRPDHHRRRTGRQIHRARGRQIEIEGEPQRGWWRRSAAGQWIARIEVHGDGYVVSAAPVGIHDRRLRPATVDHDGDLRVGVIQGDGRGDVRIDR